MQNHINNLAFWAATAICSQYSDTHSVSVHDAGHFSFGKKNIFSAIIWDYKSKSISVTLDCT
jgi:hypothetical protein